MPEKFIRITADFSEDAYGVLTLLKTTLGVSSKADVLRKALGLLNYMVQQQHEGWKLQLVKDDGVKEIIDLCDSRPTRRSS